VRVATHCSREGASEATETTAGGQEGWSATVGRASGSDDALLQISWGLALGRGGISLGVAVITVVAGRAVAVTEVAESGWIGILIVGVGMNWSQIAVL
jgi:hypothetical protein